MQVHEKAPPHRGGAGKAGRAAEGAGVSLGEVVELGQIDLGKEQLQQDPPGGPEIRQPQEPVRGHVHGGKCVRVGLGSLRGELLQDRPEAEPEGGLRREGAGAARRGLGCEFPRRLPLPGFGDQGGGKHRVSLRAGRRPSRASGVPEKSAPSYSRRNFQNSPPAACRARAGGRAGRIMAR